jgi:acylpyruvate hydrolase
MRYLTFFDDKGNQKPGCRLDDKVIDIQKALALFQMENDPPENYSFGIPSIKSILTLEEEDTETLQKAITFTLEKLKLSSAGESNGEVMHDPDAMMLAPPIPDPGKVICVGLNYPNATDTIRAEYPIVFLKPVSGVTGHRSPICLPKTCRDTHYEAELAFTIGRTCHNVPVAEARKYIAGYTIANDVGDHTLEKRTSQWVSGKMFDTFTPTGPYLVTADEIPDPLNLSISTWLNGEQVQEAMTGEMLFNIDEILAYVSTLTTLYPGDLILTGSPKLFHGERVPQAPLQPGDEIKITIGSLGTLTNTVIQRE